VPSSLESRLRLPRPDVLFLDVGDTLIRAHPSWAGVYRSGLAEAGIEVAEDELETALRNATQSGSWSFEGPFEATAEASFERVKEFDAGVLAALGHPNLADDVFRLIESAFDRRSSWFVFPDVPPAVEALAAAGVRMAVVSNWLWGAPELFHDLELACHFEALIISAHVGYQKPHAGIFEHALERMGVDPPRAVHVGDNYRVDVVGARRLGITPVLIDRRSDDPARVRDENNDPDLPVIRDLFELLDLLAVPRPVAALRPA
jgi:putative hydrolase of the HAD superfamily